MPTFPTLSRQIPSELRWGLESNVMVSLSPLSGAVQTLELPGARWRATLTYRNMSGADLALLQAFLVECRGPAARFELPCYERTGPRGVGGGSPNVNASAQTGTTLHIQGCPLSTTGWLLKGDYISFGTIPELHMLTADADTNGAGQAALVIEPPIRVSPSSGANLELARPKVQCMLVNSTVEWTTFPGQRPTADIIIDAVEAWS